MEEKIEVQPDPTRTIEGLRDTGYEFPTAVADLIDNSIAAEATKVSVRLTMGFKGEIRVTIADDGIGMDRSGLIDAMKYGSPKRPDPSSLGKYGLGLKTASTAFCRRLSVITRGEAGANPIKATWDLDHVASAGKWELLLDTPTKIETEELGETANGKTGTLVVWERVDRLLKQYQDGGGRPARKALAKQAEKLRDHLSQVFQRFLDPDDSRARMVSILVDGKAVEAWDPFAEEESDLVAEQEMPVDLSDGSSADFRVRAFVLPRKEEFSSPEAAARARIGNEKQGIYIYRENRLIHGPDWLDIYQKEPHGSLLRVEFSFDHRLDDALHIDIKKSEIRLDPELYDWLEDEFLPAPRRAAESRYRLGERKRIEKGAGPAHESSNVNIQEREKELDKTKVISIDEGRGEVELQNPQGTVRLKLRLAASRNPGELFVQPVPSIDDGLLWQPALIDREHKGVQINVGHPYYHKVYLPNHGSGVIVEGLDSLLWALALAELSTISEATRSYFMELRYEVSKLLRRLVENLPEPKPEE